MFSGLTKLAEEGDVEGVRTMLDAGTPVDFIDNGRFNATPLEVAARAGRLEVVRLLLGRGADVNHVDHDGFSPVTSAARAGEWAVVAMLAEHGGDFRQPDGHGKSGSDYLRRCRGKRNRAAVEAALARRGASEG
ncbi:ankyrin repeat domain-containing protein [Paludisphaera soli]|uniref:ankyrin repeat domain-containing protein n=1 Tax=Paludisphaera soli TaxID=2712865 RepID=UPI0013EAE149|nr:ankyrin repeat domain-containing protein [Paludisphaera soli]